MKVILDTNVFVSGVFFSGPPYQILQAWRDKKIALVVSPEILWLIGNRRDSVISWGG